MSDLIVLAAESAQGLPIPDYVYGLIAAAIFGLLLLITMSFSNAAFRHGKGETHPADVADQETETAGSAH